MRYTKDIDIAVPKPADIPKRKSVLERANYFVKVRPHGLSGYKKIDGVPIVVNTIVERVKSVKKTVAPFYPEELGQVKVNVASFEDTLILKALL